MRDVADMICGGVMLGALFGLLTIAVGTVLCECVWSWRIWRSKRAASAMSLLAFVAIMVGGKKPPAVMVTWDEYFTSKSAVVDTNDLRRIDFAWGVADGVPPIATATLSAIEVHSVNPDPSSNRLFQVATVPMTNCHMAVQMPTDATNYLYWMECSFIPDAPVVTNGVYHLACAGEPGELVTNITCGTWSYFTNGVEIASGITLEHGYVEGEGEAFYTPDITMPDGYTIAFWNPFVLAEEDETYFNHFADVNDENQEAVDGVTVDARRSMITNIHPNTVWVPMGTMIYDNSRRISPPENNGGNQ